MASLSPDGRRATVSDLPRTQRFPSPELKARLAERYPDDKALDYTAGQWRGLIRVSISDTPPPAAAPAKGAPAAKSTPKA